MILYISNDVKYHKTVSLVEGCKGLKAIYVFYLLLFGQWLPELFFRYVGRKSIFVFIINKV